MNGGRLATGRATFGLLFPWSLVAWLFAAPAHATPTFIQGNCALDVLDGGQVAVPFTSPVDAGSLIIAVFEHDGTSTPNFLTGAGAAVQHEVFSPPGLVSSTVVDIWWWMSADGGAATVTASAPSATSARILFVHEYGGFHGPVVMDVTSSATGNGTAVDTGGITTTAPDELLFAFASTGWVEDAGQGFTRRETCSSDMSADSVASSPGSYRAAFTGQGGAWYAALVSFRDLDGGAPSEGDAGLDGADAAGPLVPTWRFDVGDGCNTGTSSAAIPGVLLLVLAAMGARSSARRS